MDTETLAEDAVVADPELTEQAPQTSETHESNPNEAGEGTEQANEGEVTVSIDGESLTPEDDDSKAPKWVKEVRTSNRALQRENRELKAKLEEREAEKNKPADLGEKPTLLSCDFDADRFEVELLAWNTRKQQHDTLRQAQEAERKEAEEAAKQKHQRYAEAKVKLKVPDFNEAEEAVVQNLNVNQQSIILAGADKPEALVYALGKNPARLKELAGIKDPVAFAFAVARLETKLKIEPKQVPPPEKAVRGSASISGQDPMLAKLEAEADKTGNRTKLHEYRMKLRQQN